MDGQNFFDVTKDRLTLLNVTERKLFDYVVKNMDQVKQMSIRQFAQACYVSSATIFRFVRKLGFNGYKEFIVMLKISDVSRTKAVIPPVMRYKGYREDFLKNLIESVRVIRKEQAKQLSDRLKTDPQIYIFAMGLTAEAARYVEHLFVALGYRAKFAAQGHEMRNAIENVTDDDVVLVMSYSGSTPELIRAIEEIKQRCMPLLVSITRADNNMVQLLTELNFYVFADELSYNGCDLTSRVGMISVAEILLYDVLCEKDETMLQ